MEGFRPSMEELYAQTLLNKLTGSEICLAFKDWLYSRLGTVDFLQSMQYRIIFINESHLRGLLISNQPDPDEKLDRKDLVFVSWPVWK